MNSPFKSEPGQTWALALMIEDSHADGLRLRYAQRPARPLLSAPAKEERVTSLYRAANAKSTGGYGYAVDSAGIATILISGTITPEGWAYYSDDETISEWLVRDLAAIRNDASVKGMLAIVSSPGGYVAGSYELSDAMAAVTAQKPTATFIQGYGCSAAYLQCAQTGVISAYRTALVGSIGTRTAVVDAHRMFKGAGVDIIPVDSGGMKSAGLIGTEITDEQLAYFQDLINKQQAFFTQAVASGRKMKAEDAQKLADGRVHLAADALKLGLIDYVETLDDTVARLTAKVMGTATSVGSKARASADSITTQTTQQPAGGASAGESSPVAAPAAERAPMSQTNTAAGAATATAATTAEPKPATMAELKAGFPGASSDVLVEMSEKNMTLAAAKDHFIHWQSAQIKARDDDLAKAKTATPATATAPAAATTERKPGVPALETQAADKDDVAAGGGTAHARFARLVDAEIKTGKDRATAVRAAAIKEPTLHQQMIAEETETFNAKRRK